MQNQIRSYRTVLNAVKEQQRFIPHILTLDCLNTNVRHAYGFMAVFCSMFGRKFISLILDCCT